MLKTQILEILQNAGKCRNKKSAGTNSHLTHLNTVIFGQGDPGKTPHNSWGKPVRKLFLISGKCFYSERNNCGIEASVICHIYKKSFSVNHMKKTFVDAFRTNQCGSSSGQIEETDLA